MLYTVNNSSITSNSLDSLLRIIPKGSPILFYEDGVLNAVDGSCDQDKVSDALKDHPVYALDADLEARGIKKIIFGIQVIGYDGFVGLVEEHDVAPWL
jgi:sulfur relay protein TusB/DsrH